MAKGEGRGFWHLKKYSALVLVFLAAAILYSISFSRYAKRLNQQFAQSPVKTDEAYGVVRSFINLANKKDQQELEKAVSRRGLDLGFDVLLDQNIKLLEVVGAPHIADQTISALVLAFHEAEEEYLHYVLLFIKDDSDWFLYGLFRQ
ncbi:MAG TPA: hypothetical protein PL057_04180 [Bacillota bacterium]|nr:hypothetical protein [Bacillota bacterium]